MRAFASRHRRKLAALGALLLALPAAHLCVVRLTRIEPPDVVEPEGELRRTDAGVRWWGRSSVRRVGSLLEVRLAGSPEEIGHAHSRLLHTEMIATEGVVWELFDSVVPSSLARLLLLDIAQLRFRRLADGMSPARRRELAASARAFRPDPFAARFATYQRFVYLNGLYDISLSFEHSPLIGCTTFVARAEGGGALLARNFDFEAHPVFDEKKAVFLVLEDGALPFASVAWPGLVGVVSGMNAAGVMAVVHGARAGEPRADGEPVVHALRRALSTARTTAEAMERLGERSPIVSHLVVVADAAGDAAAVERVPGQPDFVRSLAIPAVVTNHLQGPSAGDPKNQRVLEETSTRARERRGEELLSQVTGPVSATQALRWLRDRRAAGGQPLPLGDRRAIDALIATHGVVMDGSTRTLWVSEAPHVLGRFVAFELDALLDPEYTPPRVEVPRPHLDADPMLRDGSYRRWLDGDDARGD